MEPLLTVTVPTKTAYGDLNVKFNSKGNRHLYSDTIIRDRFPVDELKNMAKHLQNAVFQRRADYDVGSKNNPLKDVKYFYYYKVDIKGERWYLNVAQTVIKDSDGRIHRKAFLYSVTKNIRK
jgi:hypothetical protein